MTAAASTPVHSRPHRNRTGTGVAYTVAHFVIVRFSAPAVLVVLWQVAAVSADSIFFPPPADIGRRMLALWLSGDPPLFITEAVTRDVLPSLGRMFAGWGMAAVVGCTLGLAIGRSQVLADAVEPALHFLRSTPGPALIPVFLILLGTGTTMRVLLIAFSTLWPVLLNTVDGVRSVDPAQLETARAFALPRRAQIWRVVVPAAMPKILAGLQVALAIALVLMVISELVAATNGIGYQLIFAQQRFRMADMWACIALLALLGYALNVVFRSVERRVLRWHRGARRRD